MDEERTVEELSLEDKMAWRRKISNVDASLRTALESSAAEHKGHFPMLSRKKKAEEPKEAKSKPEKGSSKNLKLGIDNATG